MLAALSADKAGVLGGVTIFGKGFFDLFDYLSSYILLPLGGILIALFVGYRIPKEDIKRELTNDGKLNLAKLVDFYYIILRYVTPLLVFIVFLSSIGVLDKLIKMF